MESESFVLKCGGSTLGSLPDSFYIELRGLQQQGRTPVIVHGGGPAISETLERLAITTEFVDGLRKTTEEVLDVAEMVLAGQMNKQIVRNLQKNGAKAVGLSGTDGLLLEAEPVDHAEQVGFVGRVTRVNQELIAGLVGLGYIPVLAPIGIQAQTGQRYNINADTAAGAVASQTGAARLIVVTDVPGIQTSVQGRPIILPSVTVAEIGEMIDSGDIYGGMIPKVKAAAECIQGEVQEVFIIQGSEPGLLTRALNGEAVGTRIIKG